MIKLRILIIRPGALGDTVLTAPVLAALREKYPAARIELAGRTDYGAVLVDGRLADACVSSDSAAFTSLFADGPIKLSECDIAVAYLPDADGRVAARLGERCGSVVVFDPRPEAGGRVHITRHLLRALTPLGISDADECPRIVCREEWRHAARALLLGQDAKEAYVVIHPGSGGRQKLWQAEKWAAVISAVSPRRVVLTCGPADEGVAEEILAQVTGGTRVAPVCGQPITTVAGVLAGADGYVGCDSGVTHLAAALGVRTVAILGPSESRVWAPRGRAVCVLAGVHGSTASVAPSVVLGALRGGC